MQTVSNHPLFMPILVTLVIIAAFPLVAGYIVLVERKVLADFQVRLGPMRVGPHGLLQPLADALKLMLKEDIIPTDADKGIFWVAPVISTFTGLSAFAVLPLARNIYVAVAIYYYFKIVKTMFIREAEEKAPPLAITMGLKVALAASVLLTLAIGLYPQPFLEMAKTSATLIR